MSLQAFRLLRRQAPRNDNEVEKLLVMTPTCHCEPFMGEANYNIDKIASSTSSSQ